MSTLTQGPAARPAQDPTPDPTPGTTPDLVLLGGVPGAGKTTLLATLARRGPGVRALDPERYRDAVRRLTRGALPYRAYRPLVHTLHAVAVLVAVLRGPARLPARALVVHEPGTRPRRTAGLLRLARVRGWRPALVYVDAAREEALAGQQARGRVLDPRSFDAHWSRWQGRRRCWLEAERAGARGGAGDVPVRVVTRGDAERRLVALLRGR